ncbi:MAG: stage IV sporulation protein FB [Verrucomicrobiales bacterium]|jgi:stage IV sporulation protein FB
MLRFTIFGIPTKIHWMFWATMALLGGIGRPGMTPMGYQAVAIFVFVGFISVLGHELGHAMTARKFGARPEISLYFLGGLASYPEVRMTRNQRLQVIAAGPGFGFAVALVVWLLQTFVLSDRLLGFHMIVLLWALWTINFYWSLLNILPIVPLDGGQFLGTWMNGGRLQLRSQIGTGVAAAVAVYALFNNSFFMAVMFGLLAYQNYQIGLGKRVKFF